MTRSTSPNTETETETDNSRTMAEISHANPYTGETAGQLFNRGPIVVADGGEADAVDEEETTQKMKDVSHTPPKDADSANRVFERGENGDVESEE